MATLTVKLSLISSNATTDSLNLNITDTLTFSNDVIQKRFATSTTAAKFLEADDYGKCYVYLKNLSTTAAEKIYIRTGATDSANIHEIGAGEFIFFSWAGDEDLNYDADSGTPVLEMLLFEV
tara:strand:+ start:393 stop:758 length:366 start_codon:yes stop_codon:yes gene_type:complete